VRLVDYLQALAVDKKQSAGGVTRGQHQTYNTLINHLKQYSGEQVTFKHITKEWCSGFVEYLNTAGNNVYKKGVSETFTSGLLSENTKYGYIKTLNVALNKAARDGILPNNPLTLIPKHERPKRQLDNREYLTIEEVKQLVKTPCRKLVIKNAFLFSCLTGLRFSDIRALKWEDIVTDNEGLQVIKFMQQKTKK